MGNDYTKKQHFIPRFLLANFTNKDGYIYCLDKQTGKIFPAKPENIAYQNHLYSVDYGTHKDDSLEKAFAKLESETAPLIRQIVLTKELPANAKEQEKIIYFLCFLALRAPHMVEATNNPDLWNRAFQLEDKAQRAFLDKILKTGNLAHNETFFPARSNIAEKWKANFDLFLLKADKLPYILSDKYAVVYSQLSKAEKADLEAKRDHLFKKDINIHHHIQFVFCPLSSDLYAVLVNKRLKDKDSCIQKIQQEAINLLAMNSAKRYCYAADRESLEKAAKQLIDKARKRRFKKLIARLRSSVSPLCL